MQVSYDYVMLQLLFLTQNRMSQLLGTSSMHQEDENENQFLSVNHEEPFSVTLGKEEAMEKDNQNNSSVERMGIQAQKQEDRSSQHCMLGQQSSQPFAMHQQSHFSGEAMHEEEQNQFMMDHNSLVESINKGLKQSQNQNDSQNHERKSCVIDGKDKDRYVVGRMGSENEGQEGQDEDEEFMKQSACFGGAEESKNEKEVPKDEEIRNQPKEKNVQNFLQNVESKTEDVMISGTNEQKEANQILAGESHSEIKSQSQPISQVQSQEQSQQGDKQESQMHVISSKLQSHQQQQSNSKIHYDSNSALTVNINRPEPDILDCPDLPPQNFPVSLSQGQQYSDPFTAVEQHQQPSSNLGPSRQESEVNEYQLDLNLNVYHSPAKKIKQVDSEAEDEKIQKGPEPEKSSIIKTLYVNQDYLPGESGQPSGSYLQKAQSSKDKDQMLQSDVEHVKTSHQIQEQEQAEMQRSNVQIQKESNVQQNQSEVEFESEDANMRLSAAQQLMIEEIESSEAIRQERKINRRVDSPSKIKRQENQIDQLLENSRPGQLEGVVENSKANQINCSNNQMPSKIKNQTPEESPQIKEQKIEQVVEQQIPQLKERSSLEQLNSNLDSHQSQKQEQPELANQVEPPSQSMKKSSHHSSIQQKKPQQIEQVQEQRQSLSNDINQLAPSINHAPQEVSHSQVIQQNHHSSHHSKVSRHEGSIIHQISIANNSINDASSDKKVEIETGNYLTSNNNQGSIEKEESLGFQARQSRGKEMKEESERMSSHHEQKCERKSQGYESDQQEQSEHPQPERLVTEQMRNINKEFSHMIQPRKQQGNTVFNSYPDSHQQQHEQAHTIPQENSSQHQIKSPLGSAKVNHRHHNKILSYKERSPLTEKKREKLYTKHEAQEDQLERIRLLKQAQKKRLQRQLQKVSKELEQINSKEKKMQRVYEDLHKLEHQQPPKRQPTIHQKRRQRQSEQILKMLKEHRKYKAQEQIQFEDIDKNITNNLQQLSKIRKEAQQHKKQQKRLEIMERMKKNENRKINEQKMLRANNQYIQQFKSEAQVEVTPHEVARPKMPKSPSGVTKDQASKLQINVSPKLAVSGSSRQKARIPKLKSLPRKIEDKYEHRLT